jgi:hypothetical protein
MRYMLLCSPRVQSRHRTPNERLNPLWWVQIAREVHPSAGNGLAGTCPSCMQWASGAAFCVT